MAATGRRCTERAFLEFHHVEPYALGGEATLANIQLRCRSHNAYEARLWFDNGHGNGAGSVREERAPYGGATRSGTSGLTEWSPGPAG
ncbi:MAG: HNH endonuclease [Burkholderiales bacterium]